MSAVGGQWQSDANSAERTVNKKIESRLIWGKLKRSEGQYPVSKDVFLSSATDSCQFSRQGETHYHPESPQLDCHLAIIHFELCETERPSLAR